MRILLWTIITAAYLTVAAPIARALEVWIPGEAVVVFDGDTLQELARIPVDDDSGPFPGGVNSNYFNAITFSGDGRLAFAVTYSNEVVVINAQARAVTDQISLSSPPSLSALIFTRPGGDRIYVTDCESSNIISVIDAASLNVIAEIQMPTPTWEMGFSPDGRFGYAHVCAAPTTAAPGIHVIDLDLNQVVGFIPVSRQLNGMAVSSDGRLAVGTNDSGSVATDYVIIIDLVSETEAAVLDCSALPVDCPFFRTMGVKFSADDLHAVVTDDNERLHVIDVSDPSNPGLVSSTPVPVADRLWDLEVAGDRAYLVSSRGTVDVISFDLSDLTDPMQLGTGFDGGVFGFQLALRPPIFNLMLALNDAVMTLNLPQGIETSLLAKLENALTKLEDGNPINDAAAIANLGAFVNEVEAKTPNPIPQVDAEALIAAAQAIIALMSQG